MDVYSAANIIIPCITLGVALFTPGVSKILDGVLVLILGLSVLTEAAGWLLTYLHQPNFIVYNLYMPLIFITQNYLFYQLRQQNSRGFFFSSAILILVWLMETGMAGGLQQYYFFYTYVLGALVLLVNVYGYITSLLHSAEVVKIEKSRYFWISIGILVFYIPFLPVLMGVKYALVHPVIYRSVVLFLLILLHTCFIIGIRWGNRI